MTIMERNSATVSTPSRRLWRSILKDARATHKHFVQQYDLDWHCTQKCLQHTSCSHMPKEPPSDSPVHLWYSLSSYAQDKILRGVFQEPSHEHFAKFVKNSRELQITRYWYWKTIFVLIEEHEQKAAQYLPASPEIQHYLHYMKGGLDNFNTHPRKSTGARNHTIVKPYSFALQGSTLLMLWLSQEDSLRPVFMQFLESLHTALDTDISPDNSNYSARERALLKTHMVLAFRVYLMKSWWHYAPISQYDAHIPWEWQKEVLAQDFSTFMVTDDSMPAEAYTLYHVNR